LLGKAAAAALDNQDSDKREKHIEDELAKMIRERADNSVVHRPKESAHGSKVKKAILAQYSEVCDEEDDDEGGSEEEGAKSGKLEQKCQAGGPPAQAVGGGESQAKHHSQQKTSDAKSSTSSNLLLMRNTNAEAVAQAERERREHSRVEAEKKKAQDKINKSVKRIFISFRFEKIIQQ
jgi:hypothetical protein